MSAHDRLIALLSAQGTQAQHILSHPDDDLDVAAIGNSSDASAGAMGADDSFRREAMRIVENAVGGSCAENRGLGGRDVLKKGQNAEQNGRKEGGKIPAMADPELIKRCARVWKNGIVF